MTAVFRVPNQFRLRRSSLRRGSILASDDSAGNNGAFVVPPGNKSRELYCIASDGSGWEHVSVTVKGQKHLPSYKEMCFIKNLFWEEEATVIQFHQRKSEKVNWHPRCLHLWRPCGGKIPRPDPSLLGPVEVRNG